MNRHQEPLWVERYRPTSLDDCVLPEDIRETLQTYADQKMVPNLLLTGPAGCGKTSAALALLDSLGTDVLVINGSKERGIDTLRTTLHDFAAHKSLTGQRKYVLIDEAEYLNPQSFQPAMRQFMEENSKNCGFLLTCNEPSRIHHAIRSRCLQLNFHFPTEQRPAVLKDIVKRLFAILAKENVEFDKAVIIELMKTKFPDIRNTLLVLQSYTMKRGKIDSGILSVRAALDLTELFTALKKKDWPTLRQWVADNVIFIEPDAFLGLMKEHMHLVKPASQPDFIILLDDYQDRVPRMISLEIGMSAALARIMVTCEFE